MRLGTRGSALALAQARTVAEQLQEAGHGPVTLVTITTAGDRGTAEGDKSRWTGGLERALAAEEIDLAVHSAKDVPGELREGLALLGAPARADVEDVLCLGAPRDSVPPAPGGTAPGPDMAPMAGAPREPDRPPMAGAPPVPDRPPMAGASPAPDVTAITDDLPMLRSGARVGTSSLRRAAQLRAARADLEVVEVRGNIDTRLGRLAGEKLDAIVLARAGLGRIGRGAAIDAVLPPARFVPAPGQGTLALQGRADDPGTRAAVEAIADAQTVACLLAERALAAALGASCDTPLGGWAREDGGGRLLLSAWLGLPDGSAWVADELLGDPREPASLGRRVAERMLSAGAGELLRACRPTPDTVAPHTSGTPGTLGTSGTPGTPGTPGT